MLNNFKNRKEIKKQKEALEVIKKNLSTTIFKRLNIKSINNLAGLAEIVLDKHGMASAKLCDDGSIHIKIENVYGFRYEGFTENYVWFLETFDFTE